MPKRIIFGEELRTIAEASIRLFSRAVKSTLGPSGKLVLLEKKKQQLPSAITKDGVTVSRHTLPLEDFAMNAIAEKILEVAEKTNTEAGDGPQDLNSKILTPTGWIKMGDVKIGMDICGTNKTVQKILGVFPKGKREMYEVYFSGGGKVTCCKDHLWAVTTNYGVNKTLPLKELMNDYKKIYKNGQKEYKYFVKTPIVEFIEIKEEMPIDPYFMGVLLGDGSLTGSNRSTIELSLGKNKEHILDNLVLPVGIKMRATWVDHKNYYRVKFTGKTKNGFTLGRLLESVGLLGASSKDKFIPHSYLFSSIKSRKKLLQGLIDTDGHINKRGLFEFSSVSKQLADDFADLCRGLGKQIYTQEKDRSQTGGYSKNNVYLVIELKGYKYGNKIINIKSTGTFVDMQCIRVSNSDNLYITDGYTITHNTTTAIVLAEAIYLEALKYFDTTDTVLIKESIDKELPDILQKLDSEAKLIETFDQMIDVATISANNERAIGQVVAQAIDDVGQDGFVTVEEGDSLDPTINIIDGLQLDKGVSSIKFLKEQNKLKLEDPYILVYTGKINDEHVLYSVMSSYTKNSPLVIIGELEPAVIQYLIKVAYHGGQVVHIPPSMFKDTRHKMLVDLSIAVGADLIDPTLQNPKTIRMEQLGRADLIEVTRSETNIIGGRGDKEKILERVQTLKEDMEQAKSEYDRNILKERIGRLTTGVAVIGVGGKTDDEIKEKRDRYEDAINATRAALMEGVISGGGEVFLRIADKLGNDTVGKKILTEALKEPFRQIIKNTGGKVEEIEKKVLNGKKGYDAKSHKFCDLMKSGIVDPVKVTKSALMNAVSIVDLLINLEVMSVEIPDNSPNAFLKELKGDNI